MKICNYCEKETPTLQLYRVNYDFQHARRMTDQRPTIHPSISHRSMDAYVSFLCPGSSSLGHNQPIISIGEDWNVDRLENKKLYFQLWSLFNLTDQSNSLITANEVLIHQSILLSLPDTWTPPPPKKKQKNKQNSPTDPEEALSISREQLSLFFALMSLEDRKAATSDHRVH